MRPLCAYRFNDDERRGPDLKSSNYCGARDNGVRTENGAYNKPRAETKSLWDAVLQYSVRLTLPPGPPSQALSCQESVAPVADTFCFCTTF